jgi:transcriptional regulator with XRE-family HTH domain
MSLLGTVYLKLREKLRLDRNTVADMFGVTPAMIYRVEHGRNLNGQTGAKYWNLAMEHPDILKEVLRELRRK